MWGDMGLNSLLFQRLHRLTFDWPLLKTREAKVLRMVQSLGSQWASALKIISKWDLHHWIGYLMALLYAETN
jgi:hypothetical protein